MVASEVGYYEFCPWLDSAFGPWLHQGRGRLMTRERAVAVFARWERRIGRGALFYTPVCQTTHIVRAVSSVPVTV